MAHALLSPSGSSKWLQCSASLAMEVDYRDTSSEHARIGTLAHHVAEECLRSGKHPNEFVMSLPLGDAMPQFLPEYVEPVAQYVDNIRELAEGHELRIEQRVDFSDVVGVPGSFGTADAVIIDRINHELIVADLKFGTGVKVEAEGNSQLQIYALGVLRELELFEHIDHIRIIISQPRLKSWSEWCISAVDLRDFGAAVRERAQRVIACVNIGKDQLVDEDFSPGEKQCRWCKAKGECRAYTKWHTQMVIDEFPDLDAALEHTTANLQNAELAAIYKHLDSLEDWIKTIRGSVYNKLHEGESVPGFKLVLGREGARKWSDPDAVEQLRKRKKIRKAELYESVLISPTQLEKALGKESYEVFSNFVTRSPARPTVVPESDKRSAYVAAEHLF